MDTPSVATENTMDNNTSKTMVIKYQAHTNVHRKEMQTLN